MPVFNNKILFLIALAGTFLSCGYPMAAYKKGYDFRQIKTVRIGKFTPANAYTNSGAVVANEFIRQLLASGYTVVTSESDPADAVIEGNVTEYLPNFRYLLQRNGEGRVTNNQVVVTTDGREREEVIVNNPPIQLSGTSVYNLGTAFGLGPGNEVVISNATVGVAAYLKDTRTGEILWSSTYTYEGLDLNTALQGTVHYLLRSLPAR